MTESITFFITVVKSLDKLTFFLLSSLYNHIISFGKIVSFTLLELCNLQSQGIYYEYISFLKKHLILSRADYCLIFIYVDYLVLYVPIAIFFPKYSVLQNTLQ